MATIHKEQRYDMTADQMWKRIGNFYTIHTWHPAIIKTERAHHVENARRVTLQGGSVIVEQLIDRGPRSHRYRLLSAPLPVRGYEGVISVREATPATGCLITWDATFEPLGATEAEAVMLVSGLLQAGLDALSSRAPALRT